MVNCQRVVTIPCESRVAAFTATYDMRGLTSVAHKVPDSVSDITGCMARVLARSVGIKGLGLGAHKTKAAKGMKKQCIYQGKCTAYVILSSIYYSGYCTVPPCRKARRYRRAPVHGDARDGAR